MFLKDAAVAAGLGCIGRNNLLVTGEYGPRVRLRALALDADLVSTGPLPSAGPRGFDPCEGCDAPCLRSCPRGAFDKQVFDPIEVGLEHLPGRTEHFSRATCNLQMEADIENVGEIIKYCRACELSCPVGLATGLWPSGGTALDRFLWLHPRADGKTADILASSLPDGETTGVGGSSDYCGGVLLRARCRKRPCARGETLAERGRKLWEW